MGSCGVNTHFIQSLCSTCSSPDKPIHLALVLQIHHLQTQQVQCEQDGPGLSLLKKFLVQCGAGWGEWGVGRGTKTCSKMSEQRFVVVESKGEIGWVMEQDPRQIITQAGGQRKSTVTQKVAGASVA